jgi:hypothetical protein
VSAGEPISGDRTGKVKLAFLLSEIVSILETKNAHDALSPLNAAFSDYRSCQQDDFPAAAERLKSQLQSLADTYSDLVSKSSDFQSRIDEQLRASTRGD